FSAFSAPSVSKKAASFNPGLSGERGPCKKLLSFRSNGEGKFKIEEKVNENPPNPARRPMARRNRSGRRAYGYCSDRLSNSPQPQSFNGSGKGSWPCRS